MSDHLEIGIIGYGKMGRLRADLVARHPRLRVAALADPAGANDDLPAGCRVYRSAEALLDSPVDGVFVCTPNAVTADIVIAALESGKHVFSEKPPGRNLHDVARIRAVEARYPQLKLKFGFNHRYHDAVRQALLLVGASRLGRLLWIRGVYGKSGATGFRDNWRSRRDVAGGGILLDQGIHMLDLFRAFCGDFDEVKSFVTRAYWETDVEDNAFALLRNKYGQVAMLHSSATHWKHVFSMEVFLSEGYVAINGILSSSRTYGRETLVIARRPRDMENVPQGSPREEITYFDQDRSWSREVEEFADCILTNRPVVVGTSEDALKAMELVYRVYEGDDSWLAHVRERENR